MSQKFAFYFWMCQKAFPIIICIYICLFFSHSLLSYIWKLTRKTRNYFRERVSPCILGCMLTLGESSTSCLSTFKSWNIIPFWILFIQLYPQRITVSVKTPNTLARDKYLWSYLAKIQRIPNFTYAVLLLHHHFGQNQSINKATRFQMKFFLSLRGK